MRGSNAAFACLGMSDQPAPVTADAAALARLEG